MLGLQRVPFVTSRRSARFRVHQLLLVACGVLAGAVVSAVVVPLRAGGGLAQGSRAGFLFGAAMIAVGLLLIAAAVAHRLADEVDAVLREHQLERDREVERAAAARDEADHANRAKDQFLAILGHELRNPLAPAFNAVELMRMRGPETFRREREILERQIGYMVQLVNDLMDASRLARGKVTLRPTQFELRAAVDRAVDATRPLVEQHEHTVTIDVPRTGLPLNADEDRIAQVLRNLLTNAAKYTPPRGHIVVSARTDGAEICIACEDNGPGVAPDLVPVLFDSFAQGPRTIDRRLGGLGLGLTLARNLTELHGGTIAYHDRGPERGSRFVVRLPIAAEATSAAIADRPLDPIAESSLRLLVVDDNVDAVEVLREGLEIAGHRVTIALDGPSALAAAAEVNPDVGVLDIGLPGMDGYELARRLRRSHPSMRLIALTGYGQRSDIEAAMRAGFDVHCTKPVTLAALLEQIEARQTLVA
jgi:signal transduction histidine kinase/CheY-like chemotaxis protein